jgi:hypothetical protein
MCTNYIKIHPYLTGNTATDSECFKGLQLLWRIYREREIAQSV